VVDRELSDLRRFVDVSTGEDARETRVSHGAIVDVELGAERCTRAGTSALRSTIARSMSKVERGSPSIELASDPPRK
jgi:hypothetical protein